MYLPEMIRIETHRYIPTKVAKTLLYNKYRTCSLKKEADSILCDFFQKQTAYFVPRNTNSGMSVWNNILRDTLGLNIRVKIFRLAVVRAIISICFS